MAQEEIIFKVGVDTGDSVQDVNKVGDAIENVGKDAKKADGSFVNLRKELKQLTIQLQNLDPASKEFETVAKRAGQIKEQMRGVADAINDADPEKFGGKFQRTAEGIAGAFSAVTGAQALFGQQSEEIEKQMLKVQGAIALTQGISAMKELRNDATDLAGSIKNKVVTAFQSLNASQIANAQATGTMTTLQKAYNVVIGTSTGALKGFKLALASTGIGALILALGYLITNFDKLKGSMSKGLTTAKNFETSTSRQAQAARDATDNFAEYERTLRRLGYTEEEINSKRKARYKDAIEKTQKEIAASKEVYKEQLKNLKIVEGFDKWGFNATGRLLFGDEESAKAQQQKIKDLRANLEKLKNDQFESQQQVKEDRKKDIEDQKQKQKEANQEAVRSAKERRERLKQEQEKEAQEQLALKRKISDLLIANIKDDDERERAALAEKQRRDLEDLTAQYGKKKEFAELEKQLKIQQGIEVAKLEEDQKKAKDEKTKAEIEKANNDAKALLEAEIIRAEEDFNLKQQKKIELENLDFAQQMQNTELTNGQRELLKAQHEANLVAIAKESTERQKQLDKELADAKNFLVEQTSNMFGQLASSAKQGSAIQKAFAVTQLTIDTAKSISATIAGATAAAAAGGPVAPFLLAGYIAQGVATVTSAMNTAKKLLNAPLPSVAPPTTQRPNEAVQTQQGTQQSIQAQSTYKVVVVDSDITKMQDKTKKVNAISTI